MEITNISDSNLIGIMGQYCQEHKCISGDIVCVFQDGTETCALLEAKAKLTNQKEVEKI